MHVFVFIHIFKSNCNDHSCSMVQVYISVNVHIAEIDSHVQKGQELKKYYNVINASLPSNIVNESSECKDYG